MKYEVVVVGGGVSGMTAALIFAKQGASVALVEQDAQLAPILRGFRRKGTYYDTGLHYTGGLGSDGPLVRYFNHLGVASELSFESFPEDGFDEIRFRDSGQRFLQPAGKNRYKQALQEEFPGDESAISAYFREIDKEWEESSYLNLERPFSEDAFSLERDDRTLLSFLDSLTDDEGLKAVLSAHTLLYGVPPERALLRTHAQVAGSYINSVHSVQGGGQAVVKGYQRQLKAFGVDVYCGRGVRKLDLDVSGDFSGVELEGGQKLEAKQCVYTASPPCLMDMLPESAMRPGYRKRIRRLRNSHSAFMVFGKLKEAPAFLLKRNLLQFNSSGTRAMYSVSGHLVDSPFFIGKAEADGSVVIMCPAPALGDTAWADVNGKRSDAYAQYKAGMLDELLAALAKNCPEIAGQLSVVDFATPCTFKDYGCSPAGAIYGVEHSQGQYPVLPMTKIKGLFLAGQSVVAPGVLGAVISAYVACGMVFGQDELRKEVLTCN
nr:FAD-dependent oxidoreductase [Pseudodesulfovibrio sp.]